MDIVNTMDRLNALEHNNESTLLITVVIIVENSEKFRKRVATKVL